MVTPPVAIETIAEVAKRLAAVESREGVRIIYACESGSRAWGFESPDSDYDVRFLYVHPRDWYLSVGVRERRDVIEEPIEGIWDVNGWDLRKALGLMAKSNPPFLEWLASPIVYRDRPAVTCRLRELAQLWSSPRSSHHHYLHMAKGNRREFLRGDTVRPKKYLYVLRPLLACRWNERGLGPTPVEFDVLVQRTVDDAQVLASIARLLSAKRASAQMGRGPADPVLDRFLQDEIERHDRTGGPGPSPVRDPDELDEYFRFVLGVVWTDG